MSETRGLLNYCRSTPCLTAARNSASALSSDVALSISTGWSCSQSTVAARWPCLCLHTLYRACYENVVCCLISTARRQDSPQCARERRHASQTCCGSNLTNVG